ncbi:unnamed protein product [Boreogadus saida]
MGQPPGLDPVTENPLVRVQVCGPSGVGTLSQDFGDVWQFKHIPRVRMNGMSMMHYIRVTWEDTDHLQELTLRPEDNKPTV